MGKINKIFPIENDKIKIIGYLFNENIIKEIIIDKHNNYSIGYGLKIE